MYVTRFINAAKSVQACIRSFLVCKRARVLAVLKIWDAIEVQHIKVRGGGGGANEISQRIRLAD